MNGDEGLDTPIWNAETIGREAGLFKDDGRVDLRRTHYMLEKGLLPATKAGRQWTSTRRRIRSALGVA